MILHFSVSYLTDVSAPSLSMRGVTVEPEILMSVKPEVRVEPGQNNRDPRGQRTYTEELRREPISDK